MGSLASRVNMVVKTELCNYSGFRIYPGHGKKFVRGDQKMFTFITAKSEACFKMKRRNLTTKWTVQYRRINKKGTLEETRRSADPRRLSSSSARSLVSAKRQSKRRRLPNLCQRTNNVTLC